MRQDEFLLYARTCLRALPQNDNVRSVLRMVESNIAVMYGRRGVKAFDGDHVCREVERLIGSGYKVAMEDVAATRRSAAQKYFSSSDEKGSR